MDIEEIKTLTDLMIENDLSEIIIRDGEKRILLRRGVHVGPNAAPPVSVPIAAAAPVAPVVATAAAHESAAHEQGLARINSPMVGTFYATPDPESAPFVRIGDRVSTESVVCIIEAMKVFNEIKADVTGTIESIDVQSGRPVEYGQVLMTVRVS